MTQYPPADDRLRHLLAQEINTSVDTWKLAFWIAGNIVKSPEIRREMARILSAHTLGRPCGDRNCEHCYDASLNAPVAASAVVPAADRAAEARVRALHQQYRFTGDDTTDYCSHCNQISGGWIPWPCPTIQALAAESAAVDRVAAETPPAETHVCGNCEGIDPGTCLMNPSRPADSRPRCPDCGLPHDLTPGMALACASIRASIADHGPAVEAQPGKDTETRQPKEA
ncbi:hypothetical protein [Streptomyces ossamyceticus]|uniref:hypothetical protein n=1 Tax=Streptomyces ossamyceticus TaxID=249581 RepID=UPI00343BFA6F